MNEEENGKIKELITKYGIDLEALKKEQLKLAKTLVIKDRVKIKDITRIGAIENIIVKNKIISAIILCDQNFELIEQEYFLDKLKFPYLHEFRAYRDIPSMIGAFAKLKEKPDIILIKGEGINHNRLGIASHFSIASGTPSIGVDDNAFEANETKGDNILMNGKLTGKTFISKPGSRPLYICPGNSISVDTAYALIKNMILPPHKLPEPMHLAHKYAKEIQREMKLV